MPCLSGGQTFTAVYHTHGSIGPERTSRPDLQLPVQIGALDRVAVIVRRLLRHVVDEIAQVLVRSQIFLVRRRLRSRRRTGRNRVNRDWGLLLRCSRSRSGSANARGVRATAKPAQCRSSDVATALRRRKWPSTKTTSSGSKSLSTCLTVGGPRRPATHGAFRWLPHAQLRTSPRDPAFHICAPCALAPRVSGPYPPSSSGRRWSPR